MRRSLLVLVTTCVFAAMLFPSTASAATWVIKNPSGVKMGTVVRKSSRACKVFSRSGTKWGLVQWYSEGVYLAGKGLAGDTGLRKSARIHFSTGGWWINSEYWDDPGAFAAKGDGRWVVRTVSGPRRGSAPGSCPGWAAAGAVFILSKNMK